MKLIRFSIIAFVLMLSVQFANAQSVSISAHFGRPHHRVVYREGYYDRQVYYGRPHYYRARYYDGPVYYHRYHRVHHYYRHW